MSLEIKISNQNNHCKVNLIGECTIYNVSKLKDSLLQVLEANQNILIDLEKVNDFDTAAIQLFISVKNTAKKNNKKIKIISHPNCVIAILDLYGLVSFFGDKIILTPEERKKYSFKYGTQKKKVHST
jgi:anti-anti-sigma factor